MNQVTDEDRIVLLDDEPTHDPLELPAQPAHALTLQQPRSPVEMMLQAQRQGVSLESLERMWALQVKYEEREAEKAMVEAMVVFKLSPPKIVKDKRVFFATAKGDTDYMHATHYSVTSAIVASLAAVGISHRWVPDQANGLVGVTCTLTHKQGHSLSVRLESAPDQSGGKNGIQAVVSAKSYLERHTLLAVTGMSTADQPDDDGRGAGPADADAAAFEIRDQWVKAINCALNRNVLTRTWGMAIAEIQPLNRMDVYGAVRAAMAAKTKELES